MSRWHGFPHPYLRQQSSNGITLQLPEHCAVNNVISEQGSWRGSTESDAFAVVTGFWGQQGGLSLDLDPQLGGGALSMRLDRPIDKLVLWQTNAVSPPNPIGATLGHGVKPRHGPCAIPLPPESLSDKYFRDALSYGDEQGAVKARQATRRTVQWQHCDPG